MPPPVGITLPASYLPVAHLAAGRLPPSRAPSEASNDDSTVAVEQGSRAASAGRLFAVHSRSAALGMEVELLCFPARRARARAAPGAVGGLPLPTGSQPKSGARRQRPPAVRSA